MDMDVFRCVRKFGNKCSKRIFIYQMTYIELQISQRMEGMIFAVISQFQQLQC